MKHESNPNSDDQAVSQQEYPEAPFMTEEARRFGLANICYCHLRRYLGLLWVLFEDPSREEFLLDRTRQGSATNIHSNGLYSVCFVVELQKHQVVRSRHFGKRKNDTGTASHEECYFRLPKHVRNQENN